MLRTALMVVVMVVVWCGLEMAPAVAEPIRLMAGPTPPDNPLKGLVPYSDQDHRERFPHSLAFNYVPMGALMVGPEEFDWAPLEALLNDISQRGCQAVVRVFLEYPGREDGIPAFLVRAGLKVHRNTNDYDDGRPKQLLLTPDYDDARLRAALQAFVAAFGKKYDDDPRLAYVTAGLLGVWGEWHAWPREELWAGRTTQDEVLNAYEAAFRKTPVLLRYPAGDAHESQVANAQRRFGYHDDSFAWGTLATGRAEDGWFYMAALEQAGLAALEKWKTQPIGGEIRPELWGKVFDKKVGHAQAQDFDECVRQTHVTWLMDTGLFDKKPSAERVRRATAAIQRMGYDFYVETAELAQPRATAVDVSLTVINQGVAPFYRDWPIELGAIDAAGQVVQRWRTDWLLTGLLPKEPARRWTHTCELAGQAAGRYAFGVRVVHPLANGKPLHFANADQNKDAAGWLTVGTLVVR